MEQEKVVMAKIVKQDPSEKLYLVCIRGQNGNDDSWEIIEGRESTYEYVKDKLKTEDINMDDSFVMVENLTLNNRKSIYAFMKHMENYFEDPEFDIEDYINGDAIDEQRFINNESMSNQSPIFGNQEESFERLSMTAFMDNQVESKDI